MDLTTDSPPCQASCRADLPCLAQLLQVLDGYCARHAVDARTHGDLHLIAEEACVNVIQYAYPAGEAGPLWLQVQARRIGARPSIEIVIEDEGVPFDPLRVPEPERHGHLDDAPLGGLGLLLIRRLSDAQHYARSPQGRNRFTLTKFLPVREAPGSTHLETP